MTFVSVVGNSSYINVVADGLAVFNNGIRIEDFKKLVNYGDRFITFAGTLQGCEPVIVESEKLKDLPYNIWEERLIEVTKKLSPEHRAIICVGGREHKRLTFSSFRNDPDIPVKKFTPENNKDLSYIFLSNFKNQEELDIEFSKYVKRYKSFKSRDVMLAQIDLNEFVYNTNPNEVNKRLTKLTFK